MTTVLVPAGQPLGLLADGATCAIRLGADHHELDPGEFRFWSHAFGARDVDELRQRAAEGGITAGVDQALAAMLDAGLLVTYDTTDAAETFARHVLVAQGFGRGSNPEDPDEFVIGGPALEPVAGVDVTTYAVWATSCRASLADACALAGERLDLPAVDVMSAVAEDLPDLVATGAAILDRAETLEMA